jgi:hypothetical protein
VTGLGKISPVVKNSVPCLSLSDIICIHFCIFLRTEIILAKSVPTIFKQSFFQNASSHTAQIPTCRTAAPRFQFLAKKTLSVSLSLSDVTYIFLQHSCKKSQPCSTFTYVRGHKEFLQHVLKQIFCPSLQKIPTQPKKMFLLQEA